jgi:hypothetical protein
LLNVARVHINQCCAWTWVGLGCADILPICLLSTELLKA